MAGVNHERDPHFKPVDPTTEVPPKTVARRRRLPRNLDPVEVPETDGRPRASDSSADQGVSERVDRASRDGEAPNSGDSPPELVARRRRRGQSERSGPASAISPAHQNDGYPKHGYGEQREGGRGFDSERKRWTGGRLGLRWWKIVLPLIVVMLLYPLMLGVVGYTSIRNTGHLQHVAQPTPGHTILLVGSDSRAGTSLEQVEGKRTDTIILLHRPSGSGPTVMVSIPRDSYVAIPGHGKNKINSAFAFGGEQLLVRTVEQATRVRIDSLVQTDLAGFSAIVEAMGGINVCVTQHIKDPHVATEFQPGCQDLNGAQALDYARTRATARADLDRVERQRVVLGAIAKKATSPATLLNPFRAFPMARATGRALSVDDDTGAGGLFNAGLAFRAMAGGQALNLTVPVSGTPNIKGVGSVVEWDAPKANLLFDAIRDDDTERVRSLAK